MLDLMNTPGIVLRAEPVNEYDRRVVILTGNSGKITAFANGARRQGNRLQACTDLFVFADFKLFAGRNSYTLNDATVKNYFPELRDDFTGALYGMYFLELADYCTRENNDERDMLTLLYQSLRALVHPDFDNRLVKMVFELKSIMIMGEFDRERYRVGCSQSAGYTMDFLLATHPKSLYHFKLKDEVLTEMIRIAAAECTRVFEGHRFKSAEMLDVLK